MEFKFWIECRDPLPLEEKFGLKDLGVSLAQWQNMTEGEQCELLDEYARERRNDWIEYGVLRIPVVEVTVPIKRPLKYSQVVHVTGEPFTVSGFLQTIEESAEEVRNSLDKTIYREPYISFFLPSVNHLVAGEVYAPITTTKKMRVELKRARPLPGEILWDAGIIWANESELQALDARIHVSKEMLWEQKT